MDRKKNILIVEDEAVLVMSIRKTLEGAGYNVMGVTDKGSAAIKLARRHKPDLIIMDIILQGGMDGIEAVEAIHEEMYIPVVYLTSSTDPATIKRANNTRHSGYIKKPTKSDDLEIAVTAVLNKEEQKTS